MNKWIKKLTRGIQRQIKPGRRKNQWPWKEDNTGYWVWGREQKKIAEKWRV